MAQCDICSKGRLAGRYIRHRHSAWALKAPHKPRSFSPNVHKRRMLIDGTMQTLNICTRCQRTLQKVS